MSTGIGKTQQRILSELESVAAQGNYALTVMELAKALGCSDRQIRRAVHSLAARDLVVLTKQHGGWKGQGEYGRVTPKRWHSDVPTAFVVKEGEPWPIPNREGECRRVVTCDVEFVRIGMPTGASLFVWLPDNRAKYLEAQAKQSEGLPFGERGDGARTIEREKAKEVKKVKTQPTQKDSE